VRKRRKVRLLCEHFAHAAHDHARAECSERYYVRRNEVRDDPQHSEDYWWHVSPFLRLLAVAVLARKLIRTNEAAIERVMDSNDLERERGITILAKMSNSPI